jgi:hypothetical protein
LRFPTSLALNPEGPNHRHLAVPRENLLIDRPVKAHRTFGGAPHRFAISWISFMLIGRQTEPTVDSGRSIPALFAVDWSGRPGSFRGRSERHLWRSLAAVAEQDVPSQGRGRRPVGNARGWCSFSSIGSLRPAPQSNRSGACQPSAPERLPVATRHRWVLAECTFEFVDVLTRQFDSRGGDHIMMAVPDIIATIATHCSADSTPKLGAGVR